MAVLMVQVMNEGMEFVDELTKELNAHDDPPAGLIVHVHHPYDGGVRVVDVWESQEAYQQFETDRLMPALLRLAERHGIDVANEPAPEPPEVFETSVPVRGH